jgi:hypothetical protein
MARLYRNEVVISIRSSCSDNPLKVFHDLPINIASEGRAAQRSRKYSLADGQSKLVGTESLADAEHIQNPDESWLALLMNSG